MRFAFFVILLFSPIVTLSQRSHFTPSTNCIEAYNEMVSFRIGEGRKAITKEIQTDPFNHLIILLQNYEDFVRLSFNDDPSLYIRRKSYKDKRLAFLSKSNKNSPYYRLCKGIIHLQWSMIHIKYQENWKAANDFRKAHALFKENKRLYPNFAETDIFYGAQKSIISTIPKDYQWISNLLGLSGSISQGMKMVKNGIDSKTPLFQHDALFYYVYLNEILLNDSKKALRLISTYKLDDKNIYLYTFMNSNLMLNNFNSKEAIRIILNRNKSADYMQPIIFDYALGAAYLYTSQYGKAIPYLKKYLNCKSYFYKKDAALKIAYAYYLMGNDSYSDIYKAKVKTVGTKVTDMDKQAQKIAQESFGDKNLLKAHLLFDGGSFSHVIEILENDNLKAGLTSAESLEWDYRLARVYDETNKLDDAIIFYKKTLESSNPTNEYFPARAALQLAFIYENKNNKTLATVFFKKVLSLEGHEYKTSLDHKAKSGLLRIQGQ